MTRLGGPRRRKEAMAKNPKRVKAGKKARRKATAGVRKASRAAKRKR